MGGEPSFQYVLSHAPGQGQVTEEEARVLLVTQGVFYSPDLALHLLLSPSVGLGAQDLP